MKASRFDRYHAAIWHGHRASAVIPAPPTASPITRRRTLPNLPSIREEILMNAPTKATASSSRVYTTPGFWERLWRTAGIQSVLCFIVAYIVYGNQPQVGASRDSLVAFYGGDRMRIL